MEKGKCKGKKQKMKKIEWRKNSKKEEIGRKRLKITKKIRKKKNDDEEKQKYFKAFYMKMIWENVILVYLELYKTKGLKSYKKKKEIWPN